VRTKQAVAITVNSRDWLHPLHGSAHNTVNIGHKANPARSTIAAHTFKLPARNCIPKDFNNL
jgi:hypothetical protein